MQRMAAIAMQQDSRVAIGGVEKGREAQEGGMRTTAPAAGATKPSKRSGAEVVFYFWTETFNEEQARMRIAEMVRTALLRSSSLLFGCHRRHFYTEKHSVSCRLQ